MRKQLALFALALVPCALLLRCRAPTELRLNLTTDVTCADFRGVTIAVGTLNEVETKAPAATSATCNPDGTLGSLVIVPSGAENAEITLRISEGVDRDATTCTAGSGPTGCIVARRTIRFIEHDDLAIDVPLRAACAGIVCPNDQTCVDGLCEAALVADGCGERSACTEGDLTAGDASAAASDGGVAPSLDAAVAASPAACGDVSGFQAGAIWPMDGYCPTHAGRSPLVGPDANSVLWRFDAGGIASTPPTIGADGTVYFGSNSHDLYAVNPDGTAKWQFAVGSNINNPAAAIGVDGTLYIGSADKNFYAVSAAGALVWSVATGSDMTSSATILPDRRVVLQEPDNQSVVALSPDGGAASWSYVEGSAAPSSPAVGLNGTIYAATDDGRLTALDRSGAKKWALAVDTMPLVAPAVGPDGSIFTGGGSALASVTTAGVLRWTTPMAVHGLAVSADGNLVVTRDAPQGGGAAVSAVNATTGVVLWTTATGSRTDLAASIDAAGNIYVASFDSNVYSLTSAGRLRWTVATGGSIVSVPAIASHRIYFTSSDGNLYAVGE